MYLAIIPARSGSKRIKNKNIKYFFGYPIIRYSIYQAQQSRLFKEIIVSTDSVKIKKIALRYGANVPFLRSKKLADDYAPINKVLLNVVKKIKDSFSPKYFALIYAAAPLIKKRDLVRSIEFLKNSKKADGICSVSRYSLPVQRALKVNKKNYLEFLNKKYIFKRSQDLEKTYYDAAMFCWFNTKNFIRKNGKNLNILPYFISNLQAIDIDNLEDWNKAKIKFKVSKNFIKK